MFKHLAAIVFVFVCVCVAWMILGGTVMGRTEHQDRQLRSQVAGLWGSPQSQAAPELKEVEEQVRKETVELDGKVQVVSRKKDVFHDRALDASDVKVGLSLEHRRKGLLWYPTYRVDFNGVYRIENKKVEPVLYQFVYRFPTEEGLYDRFQIHVDGRQVDDVAPSAGEICLDLKLAPKETREVQVQYISQGMTEWSYLPGNRVQEIRNFKLTVQTDFSDLNFPDAAVSPTSKEPQGTGWQLQWVYDNLFSGVRIGVSMPERVNPGPFVGRVTFFAPVSLFLFFFLVFMIAVIREIPLHPVHYFFLGCSFFAFHLLLAYLVDHVTVGVAFGICSAVSLFLSISYMRLVVGTGFAFREIGIAQMIYLVLFSGAFFLQGFTGLTIAVCCVITLFVVMQVTGRVDWHAVSKRLK